MDNAQNEVLAELLLSLVPADGSTIGNQALRQRFIEAGATAGYTVGDDAFNRLREALIGQGALVKGKGRGGAVRRARLNGEDFELQAQDLPQGDVPRKAVVRKEQFAPAPGGGEGEAQILSYRHPDKRKNNPEVGMVNPATDPEQPKTTWRYDPHIDPALQFDSGRAGIEHLIDAALASGDRDAMRAALEELKRASAPYLNWTGKAERTSFNVDTVSLHVHERIDPASILSAVRKHMDTLSRRRERVGVRAPNEAAWQQPDLFAAPFENLPLRDAIDFYRHERGWANRLIAGDSLLVMNSLLHKESMAGQVQMIYLDPPYGIKYGSNFQPFVNKRDVKDRKDEDLTQEPEMIKAFRDTWELGIHSYLTYLRDRLLLARELLHESGSVFVQISDENLHHVRELISEIFGEENFISVINFRKKTMPLGANFLEGMEDYLVWYAKDKSKAKYRQIYVKQNVEGDFHWSNYQIPEGKIVSMTAEQLESHALLPPDARSFRVVSMWPPTYSDTGVFSPEFHGQHWPPPANQCYGTGPAGVDRLIRADRIVAEGRYLRYKLFLADYDLKKLTAHWSEMTGARKKLYAVQTNESVVERCLLMTTDPGDLVLDPTCGSGTTAFVAEKWGRRWITCDTSRVAVTLAKQRLMTASYDYYALRYPHEGLRGSFIYKTVPHVTLKSIANNPEIDEIYARMHPAVEAALGELNKALALTLGPSPAGRGKQLPSPSGRRDGDEGVVLKEWTVPFDFPADWPETARASFDAFHIARQAMQKKMDASIAAHADQETLYDQPQPDKKKLRITGPFTVEAVPFPTVHALDEARQSQEADVAIARSGESARQHSWRDELLKTGIRGKGGQMLRFAELETLPGTRYLHASGTLADSGERVVVSFGPEHAALEQRQVALALNEAEKLRPAPKLIVFCAFAFDPEAAKDINETNWPGVTLLKAQMNTDLLTEDLKKGRSSNQSFWLMGQPDVEVRKIATPSPQPPKGGEGANSRREWYQVEVHGFDYFDTTKGELVSGGKGKIALWLLDTDYDERSLFPRQVFFPMAGKGEGWLKLKKDIRAELNEGLLEQFHGTVSLPFEAGENRRIAVKIVDDRGIESLKILALD